jgi:hypothetical protein
MLKDAKRRETSTKLHGVTLHEPAIFLVTSENLKPYRINLGEYLECALPL